MTDGQTDTRTAVQIDIHLPPLDKRYSPIISSICGPNNENGQLSCGIYSSSAAARLCFLWLGRRSVDNENRILESSETHTDFLSISSI